MTDCQYILPTGYWIKVRRDACYALYNNANGHIGVWPPARTDRGQRRLLRKVVRYAWSEKDRIERQGRRNEKHLRRLRERNKKRWARAKRTLEGESR